MGEAVVVDVVNKVASLDVPGLLFWCGEGCVICDSRDWLDALFVCLHRFCEILVFEEVKKPRRRLSLDVVKLLWQFVSKEESLLLAL